MSIQFVTVEVVLPELRSQLPAAIATALQLHGEPLRWAITKVTDQTATVEAVVTIT
ncbi:MAG: hypothetical protein KME35_21595 [Aphanocapsa sp. GSE-SYN-MK-11-07L]|jgi:hypothetical protein|nr:hypothetical protein [Aphanocapsa sp. GSE-SYN-MK-11-07L]